MLVIVACGFAGMILARALGYDELIKTVERSIEGTALDTQFLDMTFLMRGLVLIFSLWIGLFAGRFIVNRIPPRFPREGGPVELGYPADVDRIECVHCGHARDPGSGSKQCPECGKPYMHPDAAS